jgi:hypothetical protein
MIDESFHISNKIRAENDHKDQKSCKNYAKSTQNYPYCQRDFSFDPFRTIEVSEDMNIPDQRNQRGNPNYYHDHE